MQHGRSLLLLGYGLCYSTSLRHRACVELHQPPISPRGFFASYHNRVVHSFWTAQFPNLMKWLNKATFDYVTPEIALARNRIESWCADKCDAAEASYIDSSEQSTHQETVFSHLRSHLDAANNKSDSPPGRREPSFRTIIASELLDHCAAPQETAGTALASMLRQLSSHPAAQCALRSELRSQLAPVESHPPSPAELEACTYLNAVVLEALRLHDHTPGPPRITLAGGCYLSGFAIPPNTRVSALAYVVHHNEAVFRDATAFRPERWTQVGERERRKMQQHFWAFSSGDRQCIALHFVIISMHILQTSWPTHSRAKQSSRRSSRASTTIIPRHWCTARTSTKRDGSTCRVGTELHFSYTSGGCLSITSCEIGSRRLFRYSQFSDKRHALAKKVAHMKPIENY